MNSQECRKKIDDVVSTWAEFENPRPHRDSHLGLLDAFTFGALNIIAFEETLKLGEWGDSLYTRSTWWHFDAKLTEIERVSQKSPWLVSSKEVPGYTDWYNPEYYYDKHITLANGMMTGDEEADWPRTTRPEYVPA